MGTVSCSRVSTGVALHVTHELSTRAKGQLVLQQPRQGGAMHGAPGAVVPPVVSLPGSPCRRGERYGLCGRNAIHVSIGGPATGGDQGPRVAIRTRAARIWCITGPWRIVMAISRPSTAEGGNIQRTQQTCPTVGLLCIIHSP